MPPARKRSSRGWWLLLLLLLLAGTGGGAAWWRIQQKGSATEMPAGSIMANGNGGGQNGAANGASGPTGASGTSGAGNGAAGSSTGSAGSTTASGQSAAGSAASSSGAAVLASASGASGQGNASTSAGEATSPAAASIVDAPGSNRDASALAIADARRAEEDKPPSNPLSALTATTAGIPPQQVALADKGKATDGKSGDGKPGDGKGTAAKGDGKSAARNSHNTKARKKADGDAALLSALMSYGLPPPTSATAAALPGTPLAERLQQCRRKPFLESEQCRLQVCAGQWGLAPECPNPQAQTQMPKRP